MPKNKKDKNNFQTTFEELEKKRLAEKQINQQTAARQVKTPNKIPKKKNEKKFDDPGRIENLENTKILIKKPYKAAKKLYKSSKRQVKNKSEQFQEIESVQKISKTGKKIFNSTPIKFSKKTANISRKIVFNKGLSRSVTIAKSATTIGIGIAAVAGVGGVATVVAPQIAIPLAVASAASVGAGVAIDTYKMQKTRKLYQEDKHLNRFHQSRDLQDNILRENAGLKAALGSELAAFETKGEKSKKRQHAKIEKPSKIKTAIQTSAELSINYGTKLLEAVAYLNPVNIATKLAMATFKLGYQSHQDFSMSKLTKTLQTDIKQLNQKADCVGYESLNDLKQKSRTQKIQVLALQKLTSDPKFPDYSPEQQKEEFIKIKQDIEKKEKKFQKSNTIIELVKDIGRAHNSFSDYNSPGNLRKKVEANMAQEKELKISLSKTDSLRYKKDLLKAAASSKTAEIKRIVSKIRNNKTQIIPENTARESRLKPDNTPPVTGKNSNSRGR